ASLSVRSRRMSEQYASARTVPAQHSRGLRPLERGHRQAVVGKLLPVMLGGFAMTRPDDFASAVMDPVCDAQALVVRDLGQCRRQRRCNALEGVVVVVQDDDVPGSPEAGPGTAIDALFGHRRHTRIVVTSPTVSTVTFDVEAVRARFSALRQPLAFFDAPGGTQVPDEVIEAFSRSYRDS